MEGQLVIRLDQTLRDVAATLAREEGLSLSAYTRRALVDATCKTIRATANGGQQSRAEAENG